MILMLRSTLVLMKVVESSSFPKVSWRLICQSIQRRNSGALIAMISPLCTSLEYRSMRESAWITQTGLAGLPAGFVGRTFLSEDLSKDIWIASMKVLQSTSESEWQVRFQIPNMNGRLGIVSGREFHRLVPYVTIKK